MTSLLVLLLVVVIIPYLVSAALLTRLILSIFEEARRSRDIAAEARAVRDRYYATLKEPA